MSYEFAEFKKTLVSVKYGYTSALLGCQDEKMQTLEHFWAAKDKNGLGAATE